MQIDKIKEIIRLVDETSINEVELETQEIKLKVKKNEMVCMTTETVKPNNIVYKQEPVVVQEEKEVVTTKEDTYKYMEVQSPIVGTYYASPSPDADAFVKVGDKVKKGDVLCIIEAMKVMNEIESDFDGEVAEILVENESMVEYGQVLIKIK